MKNIKLADTLEKVRDNAQDMYDPNSQLVEDIVDDIGSGALISTKKQLHSQEQWKRTACSRANSCRKQFTAWGSISNHDIEPLTH